MSEDRARMDGIKRATVNFQVRCFAITITCFYSLTYACPVSSGDILTSTIVDDTEIDISA